MRRRRLGFWFRLAVVIVKPVLVLLTKERAAGREHVPASGGVIIAVNHISYADPLLVARFVYDAARVPRFMAKESIFRIRGIGRLVRGCGQIPVHRYSEVAGDALRDAVTALERGECVVIYPEGTVTKDPDYWPMRARTGVARLALTTGAPVIPVAQWGAQRILGRDLRPHLLPRKPVHFVAGPPVDLSRFAGREQTAPVLREVTNAVMACIREQVGELRGETAPVEDFDPRTLAAVDGGRRSA